MIARHILLKLDKALDGCLIPSDAQTWGEFQRLRENPIEGVRLACGQNRERKWLGVAVSGNDVRWFAEKP